MAKSFVIIVHDIAQSGYSNLRPGSIKYWGNLHGKLCSNFKVISTTPNHPIDLFNCKQGEREPLQEYRRRFIHPRARTPNITNEAVILAIINGLRSRPRSSRLARKLATTVSELHEVMEKYCRADANFRMNSEAQRSQTRPPPRPQQRPPNEVC